MTASGQRLCLIRHARPEGDAPLRYLGRTDPPLSDDGREQARRLASELQSMGQAEILSSPLRRARETAELIFPGKLVRSESLAVEMDFGALDGLLPSEGARLYPEAVAHLRRQPFSFGPVGGENWSVLTHRVADFAAAIDRYPEVVLVSHQFFLAALAAHLLGSDAIVPRLDYAHYRLLVTTAESQWVVLGEPNSDVLLNLV